MASTEFNKYTNSPDFKALLRKYENAMESGELVYFDFDDIIDIAEYYHMQGDMEQAEAVADYCLRLFPGNSAALLFKARMALIDFHDVDKAKAIMEEIGPDSESLEVAYVKAEIMINEGEVDEAEEYLERWYRRIKAREDAPEGTSYDDPDEGDEEDAGVRLFDFVIEVSFMFIDNDFVKQAERWIARVSRPEGDDAIDYFDVWAKIYMARCKWVEAERALNSMIDVDAFNYNAWLMMSEAQFRQARYHDALQSVEYAVAISPGSPEPYLTRGNCLYTLGDLEGARRSFERMLEITPGDAVAELLLASTLLCLKEVDEAYGVVRKLLTHIDDLPLMQKIEALQSCATICAKAGNQDIAMECCDMLEKEGVWLAETELARGTVYLEAADVDKAMQHFNNAVFVSDQSEDIMVRIAGRLYDAGAAFTAYKMLKQVLEPYRDGGYGVEQRQALAYMAAASRACGTREEYLHYLEHAVRLSPLDVSCVLSEYFPKGTEPSQYLEIEKNRKEC